MGIDHLEKNSRRLFFLPIVGHARRCRLRWLLLGADSKELVPPPPPPAAGPPSPPALHRRRQPHAAASSRRYANQGSPTPAPQQLPAAIDADSSSRSSLPQLPPAARRKPPSRRLCPASLLPQPPPSSPAAAVRNNFAAAFSLQIRPAATEESKLKGAGFRCTHCGWRIRRLFIQYSPGNIRLMKCDNCKAVADPYIECEFMIIFIDLILHKTKALLHQSVSNKPISCHFLLLQVTRLALTKEQYHVLDLLSSTN
ncbi:hypothetical protein KSP39_PZI021375 [Platanthera zijinensis]|uniref:Protein ARV n=1 Tax=Platanthera zijinensis TaxID=2320716 RepID=A0AAP0AWZ6_9ASPA